MKTPLNFVWIEGRFCVWLCDHVGVGGGRSNRASLHCGLALLVEVEFDCGLFRVQYFDVIPDGV